MNLLQSLRRGVIATAGAVVAALFASLAVSPDFLTGWVTVILVAMVPAQMIISLVWQCSYPRVLADLPQPARGVAFTTLNPVLGALVAFAAWQTVGGGLGEPTPFLIMFLIFAVAVTLLLVVPLQCWPFVPAIRHPGLMGGTLLVVAYTVAYALFRSLFDFGFLSAAPFYRPELDPQGLFMAWVPLVFAIAMLVPVLGLVLLDFWPLSALAGKLPMLGKQPAFGLVALGWFALASGGPAYPLELWLASAMLAVTFPLMVVIGSYFQFWPMARPAANALTAGEGVAQVESP